MRPCELSALHRAGVRTGVSMMQQLEFVQKRKKKERRKKKKKREILMGERLKPKQPAQYEWLRQEESPALLSAIPCSRTMLKSVNIGQL